ncbi:hypothetical protein CLU79DRAFT_777376 [Phycomyces nitens]|nr:hypothetical protein CLU79DRAFT_777376 [Phycomyces nitens]
MYKGSALFEGPELGVAVVVVSLVQRMFNYCRAFLLEQKKRVLVLLIYLIVNAATKYIYQS